jgi:hypothetical protein
VTRRTKVGGYLGFIMAALSLPLSLSFRDALTNPMHVVRVNTACAQATSCAPQLNYICSTYHSDYQNYKCATGCSKQE